MTRWSMTVFCGCIAAVIGSTALAADAPAAGDSRHTLSFGGLERSYYVHVPPSYDGSRPFPLVLVFHGGGSNAKSWIDFCGLNETADKQGFIAVYPDGTGHIVEGHEVYGWNGGPHRPGGGKPHLDKIDDIGFTNAVLDDVERSTKVDAKRVFATGMSMGAIMAYRAASEISDRIAAIAPIAGSMGTETCDPKRPVSILHIHGTEDPAAPYQGGKGKLDTTGTIYLSVDHAIKAWTKADGCNPVPETDILPDTTQDGTTATRQIYAGGKEGSEVVLITVNGGGHTWPGRELGPEIRDLLGISSKDFSANDLMWEFFEKHPRH